MNLGQQLRESNIRGALLIAATIPRSKDGVPRYSRNKELAKWQAACWVLSEELKRHAPRTIAMAVEGPWNSPDKRKPEMTEVERLRAELSLAEEGLANYEEEVQAQLAITRKRDEEIERLRALLIQAPIAKVTIREGLGGPNAPDDVSVSLYAPGLPPGEYDLYLMPEVPQTPPQSESVK